MNASRMSRSPIKDHQKTSLSINRQSPIPKNPKKSKSEINIRKKSHLNNLNQELESLKQKIQVSKGILSTIYSKVKNKESQYENQISQKQLYLHRAKQMISDYKNLYEDGLKDMQGFVDRKRAQNLSRNQQHFSKAKLQELKRNKLQKIKDKSVELQQSQFRHQKKESQQNLQKSKINQSILKKMAEQVPIQKMKKSHSAIYQNKAKLKYQKVPTLKQSKFTKDRLTTNKQKVRKESLNEKEKAEGMLKEAPKLAQSRPTEYYRKQPLVDDKKSLYEIYRQRIVKRQKQQNQQKMGWIVEKLQQNINELQLIRKKSQLKLSKYSPQSQHQSLSKKAQVQNAESFDRNFKQRKREKKRRQQKIERQQSKQRYLKINKSKLENLV